MDWQQLISDVRLGQEHLVRRHKDDRSEFRRDYDRLIFSAPFRRLQNKTQVFPLPGSIFVHNRLTHSLEVASVGRSLGDDAARLLTRQHPDLAGSLEQMGAIVSAACLAHDMGNPPFGHSGERAIATYFSEGEGLQYRPLLSDEQWADLIHFDGNANALRLLTHVFAGRRPGGFALTYSTLAAIVKYPWPATMAGDKPKFGYFCPERDTYERIAEQLGIVRLPDGRHARHPLVLLVEAADDICYEIMDIEDAHKLRLLTTAETCELLRGFCLPERLERIQEVLAMVDDVGEQVAYLRSCAIGALEHACVELFVQNETAILDGTFDGSLISHLPHPFRQAWDRCADTSVRKIYNSKDVLDVELAGNSIISFLIDLFVTAVMNPTKAYSQLLLARVSQQYEVHHPSPYDRILAVLDYVAGMTDVYALDLFRKINGQSLPEV